VTGEETDEREELEAQFWMATESLQGTVMRLFRDENILTQICGNNFMVLKVAPPLVVNSEQVAHFVSGIREVIHQAHFSTEFWTEAIGLATRAMNV